MWRIRLFRVLLPLAIVGFVVYLIYALTPRPAPIGDAGEGKPGVSQGKFKEFGPEGALGFIDFEQVEEQAPGRRVVRGVREARIPRAEGGPLLVRAARGVILGEPGSDLTMHFESGVVLEDPDVGLTLRIPSLTVDEADGTARSPEEQVVVLSGRALGGTAGRVIYGLDGRPTELREVDLTDDEGASLRATAAYLRDGLDDVELTGDVRISREGAVLEAGWMRVAGEEGSPRSTEARENVRGAWNDGTQARFRADRLAVAWDADGRPERARWNGNVVVEAPPHALRAAELEAESLGARGWSLVGHGGVEMSGPPPTAVAVGAAPGRLRGETLEASIDAAGLLREALLVGGVTYDGADVRAEASRGRFAGASREIVLTGTTERKARLAQGDYRVAGVEIRTGAAARDLSARGAVEATLLESRAPGATGMFRADRAVHFVADALERSEADGRLVFEGRVRAWQETRNLAARRIEVLQQRRLLRAREDVHTRLPRTDDEAVSEDDFVQIAADALDYDEGAGIAIYKDDVRVTLAEGRIDAGRLEVEILSDAGGRIGDVRAEGGVEIDFRARPSEPGGKPGRIRGTADRLVYDPDARVVRLLGDSTPAVVIREDGAQGTTRGREVLYRLDTGAVEVRSEGRGPARIQGGTPGEVSSSG